MNPTFSDFLLPDALLRALEKLGFEQPTPVQQKVIPLAMGGRDLMVSAATGTGKTAAFLLPLMQRFLDRPAPYAGTRALVLVPTRELARQIQDQFLQLGSYTRLTAGVIIGGAPSGHQVAALRKNPDILVATPGRLLEHLQRGTAKLDDLEVLILDEADRMLDMGFAEDVQEIIHYCRPERQSLLFSATLKHKGLASITDNLLRDPELILTDPPRTVGRDIRHQVLLADNPDHKQDLLLRLLEEEGYEKALVFTNRREQTTNLSGFLSGRGQRTGALHGELDQRERNRVLDLLRQGRIKVLVATDVAARGLDIPGMDRVINFEVPRSGSDYLHRCGRTGRAGGSGITISLVGPQEWNHMESIIRYLDLAVEPRVIQGMKAKFKGPTGSKGTKRPGSAKKFKVSAEQSKSRPKDKGRHRDRKRIGKRRQPSTTGKAGGVDAGRGPLKKRD